MLVYTDNCMSPLHFKKGRNSKTLSGHYHVNDW
jgi:hypothetical protein